jgi:hypothetical protein
MPEAAEGRHHTLRTPRYRIRTGLLLQYFYAYRIRLRSFPRFRSAAVCGHEIWRVLHATVQLEIYV